MFSVVEKKKYVSRKLTIYSRERERELKMIMMLRSPYCVKGGYCISVASQKNGDEERRYTKCVIL